MAITANTGSNNWNTNGAWVGGVQPTAADDVIIPASAVVTIPASTTALGRSVTVQASGTVAFAATTSTLAIGGGTAGASNVALSVSSTATITLTGVGTINLVSTSATQQTITTGGKTLPSITVNGAGSSYILGDALTWAPGATFTLTSGTFNSGNYSMTGGILSTSGSTARTLTLGSSTITLSSSSTPIVVIGTNLTMTSNTAGFTVNGVNPRVNVAVNMNGSSLTYNGGGAGTIASGGTWSNVTFTGTATKTDRFGLEGTLTATGTFTVNGNSTVNRVLVWSTTIGSSRTITAATVTVTNADFMDITGAGAGSWNVASITGNSGDCGGNSGITFTTPATQTNTGATGSWSDSTKWTSRVPLPQDDVVINTGSGTITANMPRLGKSINFTGFTGTASFNTTTELYGSLTLASGMTLGANTQAITLAGRSSYTITSAGKQFPNQIQFNNYGGTYTLQDALYTTQAITQFSGTFNTNNQTVTCLTFATRGSITRVLTFGTSTINLTSTAATTVWSIGTTGLTMSAASSTIVISTASGNTRIFISGGQTYGTITYTVANSPGALNITGSSTYGTINLASGRGLIPNASGVYAITGSITGSGSPVSYVYMPGDSYGASVPDSANTSIANDIDIRLRVALDDVSKAGGQRIAAKYGAAGQRSWRWYIAAGLMNFETSSDGTATTTAASLATPTLAAAGLSSGTTYWLRVARDRAAGTVKFYYAADSTSVPTGGSWTQLGSTITGLSTATIFDSTALTTVGGETAGTNSNPGKYYRFQVCSNLADDGSAIQIDANFATKTFGADTFTESSSNAATVTMANNSVFGDGRLQIYSGSPNATFTKPSGGPIMTASDYVVVQYIKVNQPYSFFAGANSVNNGNNTNVVFSALPSAPYRQQGIGSTATATSLSATYPTATTAGSLLVAHWTANATPGTITPPSGWTLAKSNTAQVPVYIWYKIANGTEATVTVAQVNSAAVSMFIQEISGWLGTPTLDVTDSNSVANSTTISTTAGSGVTNTMIPAYAVAMNGQSQNGGGESTVFTNGYQAEYVNPSINLWVAAKPLTTIAAQSTTHVTGNSRALGAALAVFKDSVANGNFFQFFN